MTRSSLFIATIAICISILGGVAMLATASAKDAGRTAIISDERAGTVRIVIEGRDVAIIDADGLHVKGDIEFTGVTVDTGGYPGDQTRNAREN